MGFPTLIIALCLARGVIFDSLTFESLSLAINLAYIRKNYWNPEDPSITFLGSHKAKAQAPSDAPVPAPTPVAPIPARAYGVEYSSWHLPGDAEYAESISTTADYEHEGVSGTGSLARSPAFLFGGR